MVEGSTLAIKALTGLANTDKAAQKTTVSREQMTKLVQEMLPTMVANGLNVGCGNLQSDWTTTNIRELTVVLD
jgi:hypothetical protein